MRILIVSGLLLLAGSGCIDNGPGDLGPEDFVLPSGASAPVTMDSSSYTLESMGDGYRLKMTGTFTNPFHHLVYLQVCFPEDRAPMYDIPRADSGEGLVTALSNVWACVGMDKSPALWPGRTVTVPVEIGGTLEGGRTLEDIIGEFRLALILCVNDPSDAPCERLPLDSRSSAPFTILPPP